MLREYESTKGKRSGYVLLSFRFVSLFICYLTYEDLSSVTVTATARSMMLLRLLMLPLVALK